MPDYQDRNSIAEIENDQNQETLEHYQGVLDEQKKSADALLKTVNCMGNAELEGEDQDLICQLLVEKCAGQLMDIVANGCSLKDPSLQEAVESTRMVRDLVNEIQGALNDHFLDS